MFSFLFDSINIALVVTALLNFFLGVLIFINGRNKRINIVYSLNIAAIISWILAMFFYRSSPPETNLLWCTILYVTPTLIASSFLYFTYIFPSQNEKYIWWSTILIFGINLAIILMVIWPGLIIKEVNIMPGQEKEIIFTAYYWFYFLYTLSFFSFGFLRLFVKYLKNRGIERLQIIYLVTGYSLAANLAFVTNLILPWLGFFFLNWLGQILTCTMVAFTAYAILRYRLMDIRIVARKTFIYIVSAGFAYGFFYFLIWFYANFLGGFFTSASYIWGLFISLIFVAVFIWFFNFIQKIANKYFFYTLYNYQKTINNLSQKLNYLNDLDEIISLIVDTVKKSFELDRAEVLLIDKNTDNFLAKYLQEKQKPLVREEIQIPEIGSADEKYRKNIIDKVAEMKENDVSLYLPLMSSEKLIGIIVLGSKVSKDAYTEEDLNLLSTLAYQAGIAIDNARLYKEIRDFNKTLQQKVDEQTKDIKKAYEVEKQANEELKQLDEAKTQFMVITNHHLRTPLTAINWYTELLLLGKYGKISVKPKAVIEKIRKSTIDEIKIVSDLLDVSQFQLGTDNIEAKQNVDIGKILKRIKSVVEAEAQQKGIYLKIEKLGKIPLFLADESKLEAAIENIVDNAVKYTEKGGITITLKIENFKLKIIISDTGIGMTETESKNLFSKIFERGEDAQKLFAVGRGIGLYLSAKIIEAHKGKIWAESAGKNKGTAFFIELPVV